LTKSTLIFKWYGARNCLDGSEQLLVLRSIAYVWPQYRDDGFAPKSTITLQITAAPKHKVDTLFVIVLNVFVELMLCVGSRVTSDKQGRVCKTPYLVDLCTSDKSMLRRAFGVSRFLGKWNDRRTEKVLDKKS
jgi:hypothetical protein